MRRLILAALVVALLCGASWGTRAAFAASKPVVYAYTLSASVSQADLDAAIPALQTAVSRDLAASWGTDATLTTDPAYAGSADMTISIDDGDGASCMCYGFHDVAKGRPYSVVYGDLAIQDDGNAWLTFTHELFEMLVDPWINHYARYKGKTWLVEVGDPVERDAYSIDGIQISDFITPRWYNPTLKGPFDFMHLVRKAGTLTRGGYASWLDDLGWHQVFA